VRGSPSGGGAPLVLKIGGELLDDPSWLEGVVAAIAVIAASGVPLVVIHGGGREIDAALKGAGIEKRQVEGLRITDERTLDVVVSVLAGTVNTRLVAALTAADVPAVGLTGVDGACGLSEAAPPHRTVDGRSVDLGRVGVPSERADMRLLSALLRDRFLPVIASIGVGGDGQVFNINADTFAGHLAARLGARRLVIAGTTSGVLGDDGATVPVLDGGTIGRLVAGGTATAGMIAKLRACERALAGGVEDVVIVDGRDRPALQAAATGALPAAGTRVVCAGLKTCATTAAE
jgi:acetylglutamate kinase